MFYYFQVNLVALGDSVIQEKIDYLKGHNVLIIILVSHADFETNKGLALKFPEIDLVVGGERNFLYTGTQQIFCFFLFPVIFTAQHFNRFQALRQQMSKWMAVIRT